jgi:hypothetical protein
MLISISIGYDDARKSKKEGRDKVKCGARK